VRVSLSRHGEYDIGGQSRGILDLDAYTLARAEAAEAGIALALRPVPWLPGNSSIVVHDRHNDAEWQEVLNAYSEQFGTSLEAVLHVLFLLMDSSMGRAPLEDLIDFCRHDWSGDARDIAAALNHLILRADDLRAEGVQPWRNQERVFRLVSHPLVELPNGEIAVMPAWLRGTTFILFRYLSEGRLPHPPKVLNRRLEQAMSAYRNLLTVHLESEVTDILMSAELPFRANVNSPATLGLRGLSGEIDHVCAVDATKTIWVLEEKSPVEDFSVDALRRSLARFIDPGAYLDKLGRKVRDIERDIVAVARALDVSDKGRWRVRGVFVTPRPIPAAFATSEHSFVTPSGLISLLTGRSNPNSKRRRRRR